MTYLQLVPSVVIDGRRAHSTREAGYLVRRHVMETDDESGRELARMLSEAATLEQALDAERELRRWLRTRQPSRSSPAREE
jgi:hypothetical protein